MPHLQVENKYICLMLLSIPYIPLWESLHVPALNAKVNATTQAPTKVHNKENSNLPKTGHKNWQKQN